MEEIKKPTKKELLEMLKEMADNIERLPVNAQLNPITHYDFWSLIALLSEVFKADCKDEN